jgi:hypothetical protein
MGFAGIWSNMLLLGYIETPLLPATSVQRFQRAFDCLGVIEEFFP